MEYIETVIIPTSKKKVTHFVASCIKCNSDDITVSEYEDNYGSISTVKCKSCKNEVRVNAGVVAVIKLWNKENDIETLITDKIALIETTKVEIKELKVLQRTRRVKKTKTLNYGNQ